MEEIKDNDLYVDPENIEALAEALKPAKKTYPLTLPSGAKLAIPIYESGMAMSMEAGRGEARLTQQDKIDPDRERRFFIKRINRALADGWEVVDDLKMKNNSNVLELLKQKKIAVSLINPADWNTIQEVAFPGFLDESETVRNRARSIGGGSVQGIPRRMDAE